MLTQEHGYCKKIIKTHEDYKETGGMGHHNTINSNNIRLFSFIPQIDGFLIGGASQSSKKFIDIMKNYYK